MNIFVLVLAENSEAQAHKYINDLYPDSKVKVLSRNDIAALSFQEKIECFRKEKYDLALVFSDNLQYQTKIKLLKGILLFVRAKQRQIVDDKGNRIGVGAWDFVFINIPTLAGELILSILGLLFSFVFLNVYFLILKNKKKRPQYEGKGEYFAFDQSTFAFSDVEGGDASYRLGIADGFAALGREIRFFTSCSSQFKGTKRKVYLIKPGRLFDSEYDIHKLMYNYSFIWKAARLFSHSKPSAIIQYHDSLDFSGVVLATIFNVPLIIDVHNVDFLQRSYWYQHHLRYFVRLAEKICMSRADLILVVSEELKGIVSGLAEERKILVKPNGINEELFKPQNRGGEIRKKYGIDADVVVGYSGSFDSTHGIEAIADAIEVLCEKKDNVHFLFVGRGPKYSYLKDFISRKGLQDRVSMVGDVPHYQLPAYLDACDILIALYTHADFFNSPMKIFEYMAMEKVTVATSQGQINKIIDDGENGVLINLEDKNSLVEVITLLADDKNKRIKIGKAARKKVVGNYTWKMTAEKIINAYQQVVTTADGTPKG